MFYCKSGNKTKTHGPLRKVKTFQAHYVQGRKAQLGSAAQRWVAGGAGGRRLRAAVRAEV